MVVEPDVKKLVKEKLQDATADVLVTFVKADGTERTMRCTTVASRIPTDKAPKGTGRSAAEGSQRVFDLDKGEWRSFKWDSVVSVGGVS